MKVPVPRQVLDDMLAGRELEEEELRELASKEAEGLHLDFKDGKETHDSKKAARTLRRYVCGFANSDGGLLIIGVSNGDGDPSTRQFTAAKRPGAGTLAEWARTVLEGFAGALIPPPRIQVLTVDGCEVLIVATARAPSLVACAEGSDVKYYVRIGDSTPPAPPYLVMDLMLGRRAHPTLEVVTPPKGIGAANGSELNFGFHVENASMVPASDVTMGVVSWATRRTDGSRPARPVAKYLLNFIEADDTRAKEWSGTPLVLLHATGPDRSHGKRVDLAAFERGSISIGEFFVPRGETIIYVRSALYVVAAGHPPIWYQLDWFVPGPGQTDLFQSKVRRLQTGRPIVAWNTEWSVI